MTQSNTFTDARTFWTVRAGQTHRQLRTAARREFRKVLQPADTESRRNVADLADGRIIALWMAAAVSNPEWAQRFVAWTLDVNDEAVRTVVGEIVRVTTHRGGDSNG